MRRAADDDGGFALDRRDRHPDAAVRHEEGDHAADDHQETAGPNHPDAGVLGDLQAGVLLLVHVDQRKDVFAAAAHVKLRIVLENGENPALPGLRDDLHSGGAAEPLEIVGVSDHSHAGSAGQLRRLTLAQRQCLLFARPSLRDGQLEGRVSGRPIARLVEGDPLVIQRIVDLDRLAQNFPAVFEHDQVAGEVLGAIAVGVIGDFKVFAGNRKTQGGGLLAAALVDDVGGAALEDVDVGLVAEAVADDGADEDDQDRQVGDINPEAGPGALLGEEMNPLALLADYGRGKVLFQQVRHLFPQLGNRLGTDVLHPIRQRPVVRLVRDELRLLDRLHHPRQALDGAGDQVQREDRHQPQEPPGVVHVEEVEGLENLELGLAEALQVLLGTGRLRQNGADDRGDGEQDECGNRQLEGAEEVPHHGQKIAFFHCQALSPMKDADTAPDHEN